MTGASRSGDLRLDPRFVQRRLREAGLRARHALSQNFLADVEVLEAILREAGPEPGREVLEIGPGLGFLTGGLLAAGTRVTAVEVDRGLVALLGETFTAELEAGLLRLVEGDALDQDLVNLVPPPYHVVANLPYHITSPVLHRLLGSPPRAERLVLMVQREVAERISAAPGAMSYLSVFVQYHATVRVAFAVPRQAFEPAPEVESAVVEIVPFEAAEARGASGTTAGRPARLSAAEEDDLWRVVQAGFRERRKMLRNVLGRQLPVPGPKLDAALAECGIAGDRRPQTLSVGEWLELRRALGPLPGDSRGQRS